MKVAKNPKDDAEKWFNIIKEKSSAGYFFLYVSLLIPTFLCLSSYF